MASKHPVVTATEEERTSVDPGALDSWQDERTVADAPEAATTNVASAGESANSPGDGMARRGGAEQVAIIRRGALGSENETVDEATLAGGGSDAAPSTAVIPEALLVVRTGPHEGQSYRIDKPTMTIGRALDNDIVIADLSISRRHLAVSFDGRAFTIQDLKSGNGTIINGRDEDSRYALVNRDALELGRSIITFECEAMAAIKPTLAPPKPRDGPAGKPLRAAKPEERPTLARRNTGEDEDLDFDEDARTIAGNRPPGLDMPGTKPPLHRGGKQARLQDLVMPRDPMPSARPRLTVASPAVPAPKSPHAPPLRLASGQPTLDRPVVAPPIIAPIALDEEAPTSSAAPHRRGVVSPIAERRTAIASAAASPAVSRPLSVPAPMRSGPSSTPPAIMYPTAPPQFNRSGNVVALSPRSSPATMRPMMAEASNGKWVAGIALIAVATVVGVTVAAISGSNGSGNAAGNAAVVVGAADAATPQISPLETGPDGGVAVASRGDADAAPVIEPPDNPVLVTLAPRDFGTYETVLETLPEIPPDEDKPEPTEKDKPDDAAFAKRTAGQALAAYRDRDFANAASLSRSAAAKAGKRDARTLRRRASDLARMQSLLSSAKSSDPISAFDAYRSALKIDRRLGRKHQTFINVRLLAVGPDAARSYMGKGQFSKAAFAVTVSRKVGDRTRTQAIMESLERKAKPLIAKGKAAAGDGDKKDAKSNFNKALVLLPYQSPLHADVRERIADL